MLLIPDSKILSFSQTLALVEQARSTNCELIYLPRKHQVVIEKNGQWQSKIYLSWLFDWDHEKGMQVKSDPHFALALIKAGQAAVGYFHQGELIDHRVFRAYMVRQKQGKSQIKHLKTKGKSRAGSRIRLGETERFFEEINERLTTYETDFPIDFWGVACGKTLWPFWFDSKTPPPFSSQNSNLIELPFHVRQASFEELEAAGKLLCSFHVLYLNEQKNLNFTSSLTTENDEENW